ncbi:MAG: hypothetical protein HC780_07530 [Leptolyngbyaceae cyanobacterium CSU_1_3]|nr:hypothetical protein [Leptolyngbyaceae cyanobacterium CSU_1_3]
MNSRIAPTDRSLTFTLLKLVGSLAGWLITAASGVAQASASQISQVPQCQPPSAGEFLLLVVSTTSDAQTKFAVCCPTLPMQRCATISRMSLPVSGGSVLLR